MTKITLEELRTARIDQLASPPKTRIKPQLARIVVVGGFLGLMFGCGGAWLINLIQENGHDEVVV